MISPDNPERRHSGNLNPIEIRREKEGSLLTANVTARDLNEAWFLSLKAVMEHGYEYVIDRGSFVGTRRKELDDARIHILNLGVRPLSPIVPEGVPPPTNDDYIENYMLYLVTSEKAPGEAYTYGEFIEKQMYEVIKMYKEKVLTPIKLA